MVAPRPDAQLRAQGKIDDAAAIEQRFKQAWKDADYALDAAGR